MSTGEPAAALETRPRAHTSFKPIQSLDRRRLFLTTTIVAAVVFSLFQSWNQPSQGDRANWDYFAQVIVRGGVPYRDVVNIKSPLSAYIGAAAILVTHPLGLRDILAIRVTFLLLTALTVGLTFLVALDYIGGRGPALLAAAAMLSFDTYVRLYSAGVQPKTPMVLFGLMALWAIARDRPFLAGLTGMLSALSWQPGLLFVGVSVLAFSRYFTRWRDMKAVRVLIGAAITLAVLLIYFWLAGALADFYLWCIRFNATVYGPNELRSFSGFFRRLLRIIQGDYSAGRVYFYAAAVGAIIAAARDLWQAKKKGRRFLAESAPRHAVLIAALVYFLFCMVDIQGGADLIPLLPFVSIFASVAALFLIGAAINAIDWRGRWNRESVASGMRAALCTAVFVLGLANALGYHLAFPTLADQEAEVSEITSHLGVGDKIFVHGQTEVLVLSGLPNASKYFLLDRGKDRYLDVVEPGGFEGWLDRLKAEKPKVVVLDRLRRMELNSSLQTWMNEEYQERAGRLFTYYLRKTR